MSNKENIDIKIGQKIVVDIEKIVFSGEGLARYKGFTVFVPMSVPEDKLEIEIISVKKNYARGIISKLIIPSKWRIDNSKITFEDYDGCNFAMMTYEKQIEEKEKMLVEVFNQIAKININSDDIEKEPIIPSNFTKNYRNKTSEPVFKLNGEIKTGFYKKKSHDIFYTENNILRSNVATDVINKFLIKINKFGNGKKRFTVFNQNNKTGFLRHVVVRNNENGDVMLVIVINKKTQFKQLKNILCELYEENENIKSIYISVKNEDNNVILGEENLKIRGKDFIVESIDGLKFKIYPNSFFQVNKTQAENLYNIAYEYIKLGKMETIVDAFSGTGTIAMLMSKAAKKVYAIESVENSVLSGRQTIEENNINNVEIIHGKVENILGNIIKKEHIDSIIFDPPRRGLDEKTLNNIVRNRISSIVYISCNPSTQARDVKYLCENGYVLKKIRGIDLFPQTSHIESIVLLERK